MGVQNLQTLVESKGQAVNFEAFLTHVLDQTGYAAAVVDCNRFNEEVVKNYVKFLNQGVHIISANLALFSPDLYDSIRNQTENSSGKLFYNECLAGGFPLQSILKEIQDNGAQIYQMEGIISPVLNVFFSTYSPVNPGSGDLPTFVQLLQKTPEISNYLDGQLIAHQLCGIGQACGYSFRVNDIEIENLIPKEVTFENGTLKNPQKLEEIGKALDQKRNEASKNKQVLRYVCTIDPQGHANVHLKSFETTSVFAELKEQEIVLQISTDNQGQYPVIFKLKLNIASCLFSDLISLATLVRS